MEKGDYGTGFKLSTKTGDIVPIEAAESIIDPNIDTGLEEKDKKATPLDVMGKIIRSAEDIADAAEEFNEEEEEEITDPVDEDSDVDREDSDEEEAEEESEEEEEEGEEEESDEEEEEDTSDNIFKHLGAQFKEEGHLPKDFEVDENITARDLYNGYRDNIKEKVTQEVQANAVNQLINAGFNEETLGLAQLIAKGVDPNTLYQSVNYTELGNTDLNTAEKADKLNLVEKYYIDRKFEKEEIANMLEDIDLGDIDIDAVSNKAKKYFTSKAKVDVENQLAAKQERDRLHREAHQNTVNSINRMIEAGNIGDLEIPNKDELKSYIFDRNTNVQVNGRSVPVTELEKFKHLLDTDINFRLQVFMKNKYENEITKQTKKKATKKAEDNFLSGYRKSVKGDTTKIKKTKKTAKRKAVKSKSDSVSGIVRFIPGQGFTET